MKYIWNAKFLALLALIPAWIGLFVAFDKQIISQIVFLMLFGGLFIWVIILAIKAYREIVESKKESKVIREFCQDYKELAQRVESIFSRSHTHSIFYVWGSFSRVNNECRMDNSHYQAMHAWVVDMTRDLPPFSGFAQRMRGLSVAIAQSTYLAEKAHGSLQELINSGQLTIEDEKRLRSDWATSRDEYNDWLRGCIKLFKRINRCIGGAECCEHFNFVQTLE